MEIFDYFVWLNEALYDIILMEVDRCGKETTRMSCFEEDFW